jgi:hypothetical protein
MVPDEEDAEDKKTRVHPQTNNPRFDEIFAYPLTETELINKKMIVKVMDHDVLGRDDILGEVIIDINTFNFRDSPIHTAWYTLNMEVSIVHCYIHVNYLLNMEVNIVHCYIHVNYLLNMEVNIVHCYIHVNYLLNMEVNIVHC